MKNYVEPFCGSCAVLLARPLDFDCIETVNDKCAYVANFWRALKAEPEALANLMDWPINECDLEARHKWLVEASRKEEHQNRMRDDPDYYDVRIAAWWCWGLCAWIGAGWCSGVWHGRGDSANAGRGINIRYEKRGGKIPLLSEGCGVHRRCALPVIEWMHALAARLRRVSVCCGDWRRVCTKSPTFQHGLTAVFLDPPYSADAKRSSELYRVDDGSVAHEVRDWCLANGDNKLLRIALCGYDGEGHEELEKRGWSVQSWKANGGYGNMKNAEYKNKYRERIWFSPACLSDNCKSLFDD